MNNENLNEEESEDLLQWDDEEIGRLVKYLSNKIYQDGKEEGLFIMTSAYVLCNQALLSNAEIIKLGIEGLHNKETNEDKGDWLITIENKRNPNSRNIKGGPNRIIIIREDEKIISYREERFGFWKKLFNYLVFWK
jgi:hypothetical protein